MNENSPINKTMDRADLERSEAKAVVDDLDALIADMSERGLPLSSWYGKLDLSKDEFQRVNRGYGYAPLPTARDDENFPWFLYWEIAWIVLNNDFKPGQRLLDLGGSGSLFSYYMASKGVEVTTVDLQPELVERADEVARATGWPLENVVMDMRELAFDEPFDHITSICVFEHIPLSGRIEVNSLIRELLVDGGTFSITFDYVNPIGSARIGSPEAVREQFVAPSGLTVRDNETFHDNGERYLLQPFFHPSAWRRGWKPYFFARREFGVRDLFKVKRENDYTFGALFQQR